MQKQRLVNRFFSRRKIILLFMSIVILQSAISFAYLTQRWSYRKLAENSELIIVGTPTESKSSSGYAKKSNVRIMSTDTTVEVKLVLKGKIKGQSVVLYHYWPVNPENRREPKLYIDFDSSKGNTYLMFLKKADGGCYIPATGQVEARRSIRLIERDPFGE